MAKVTAAAFGAGAGKAAKLAKVAVGKPAPQTKIGKVNSQIAAPKPAAKVKAPAPNLGRFGAKGTPYQGSIMSNQQMINAANQAATSAYQPAVDSLNSQLSQAQGLAQKRSSDAQNFAQWMAGQQQQMQATAAARDQQYTNLMNTINSSNQAPASSATSALSNDPNIISNMANSSALQTAGQNTAATQQSTQGALDSAAANQQLNAQQQNAWGAITAGEAANIGSSEAAGSNQLIQSINQSLTSAQSDEAQAKSSALSSLQSQNASNIKGLADYRNTQQSNALKQASDATTAAYDQARVQQAAQSAKNTYNLGVQKNKASYLLGQQKNQTTATHDANVDNINLLNAQTTAALTGAKTVETKQEGKSLVLKAKAGLVTAQANATHQQNEDEANTYKDVTDRLYKQGTLKEKLLADKISQATAGSKINVDNATIQRYAAETGLSKAEAKSDIIKAYAYAAGQNSSSTNDSKKGVEPLTTDSLATRRNQISGIVQNINLAMSQGIKGQNGGKPLTTTQMRTYLQKNYGKNVPEAWIAFDQATGRGLSNRTVQMAKSAGYPDSYLNTFKKSGTKFATPQGNKVPAAKGNANQIAPGGVRKNILGG